eukprot:Colp12_sorted_trinity150504_noHs@10886
MARELNMDTIRQNFWKESINKEKFVRIQWHETHGAAYNKRYANNEGTLSQLETLKQQRPGAFSNGEKVGMFARPVKLPLLGKPIPDKKELEEQMRSTRKGLKLSMMREPEEKVMKLLYSGLSKEGEGRASYLKTRRQEAPQEKFVFPVTRLSETWLHETIRFIQNIYSAQTIGWSTEGWDPVEVSHGRRKIISDTFYRKNAIFYDTEDKASKLRLSSTT